jgi:hypothetical protein
MRRWRQQLHEELRNPDSTPPTKSIKAPSVSFVSDDLEDKAVKIADTQDIQLAPTGSPSPAQRPTRASKPSLHQDLSSPASHYPTQLLDGESLSLKGIPISIKRMQIPNATLGAMTIEIHYGGKGASSHAGRRVWYSDIPRHWPKAIEVLDHYLNDRSNLGVAFRDVPSRKRNLQGR